MRVVNTYIFIKIGYYAIYNPYFVNDTLVHYQYLVNHSSIYYHKDHETLHKVSFLSTLLAF